MTLSLCLAFFALWLVLCLTPGPAVLLVTSQAMARGYWAGVQAALGVQAGNTIYFLLSVAGLGAVLATSALAFTIIKYAGGAYLIYLGVTTIRNARKAARQASNAGPVPVWAHPFAQGFMKQLANPKAVLSFGALLPQFIIPGQTQPWRLALILATMYAIEVPILAAYSWAGARGGSFLRGPTGILWRERVAGAAQIAVGGLLAGLRKAA